jgi:hypothetical protein
LTKAISPILVTKAQAAKRAKYDAEQGMKTQELERIQKIANARRRQAEEVLMKKRRREELVHKPLPMPKFGPPSQLMRSSKMLTIPKSPKLNTKMRATGRKGVN